MCVILYTEINGKKFLIKNRDKNYKPDVELIHEIINGIEVAYVRDKYTGWIEGMNENGLGLINSTLSKLEGKLLLKKTNKGIPRKQTEKNKKNNLIYKAIVNKHIDKNFYDIIKDASKRYILEGHTLLFYNNQVLHIENDRINNFVIEKITKPAVFSNHGVKLKKEGYIKGSKAVSSFLRRKIVQTELSNNKIKSLDDVMDILTCNYININPRFHPYRDRNFTLKKNKHLSHKTIVSTTSQLILNMTDKEITFCPDIHNSKNVDYVNKLPKDYTPKIQVIIKETQKQLTPTRNVFTKKYLNKIYDHFNCITCKKNVTKKQT
jgi:hypothetical protein